MTTTKNNPDSRAGQRPSRFPWPPVLLLVTLAVGFAANRAVPLPWPGLNDTAAQIVQTLFGIGGVGLIGWAAIELRRSQTTIMPHRGADQLVTTGPFWRFRNPIYLGDVLIMLSIAGWTQNVWLLASAGMFALLVTWLAILPEERHLAARFGDAYVDYKSRSRRWI